MAQFPALPLFTDAYLADTRHLSAEQHGAYLLLLMEAWRRPSCSLPDDDDTLARLACMSSERWSFNRDTVMEFWTLDGRKREWTQARLLDERAYVVKKSRSQSDKAAKRWNRTQKANAVAMPEGMPEACPDDAPTPTPTLVDTNVSTLSDPSASDGKGKPKRARASNAYTPEYEALWSGYPSTVGMSKLNGFKAWQRLTPEHQARAVAAIPAYRALLAKSPERTVKHVQGYLSSHMFESFPSSNVTDLETPVQWEKRLAFARTNREWSPNKWGPLPGCPGCRVPADLLQPGDGQGWHEQRAA